MTPKVQKIIDEVMTRLSAIDGEAPYQTAIGRKVQNANALNFNELPGCIVIRDPRELDESTPGRAALISTITIQAGDKYQTFESAQQIGEAMLADIAVAVETKDYTLGGLVREQLAFARDLVIIPESASNVVVASVTYSIPHIRRYGDPYT